MISGRRASTAAAPVRTETIEDALPVAQLVLVRGSTNSGLIRPAPSMVAEVTPAACFPLLRPTEIPL